MVLRMMYEKIIFRLSGAASPGVLNVIARYLAEVSFRHNKAKSSGADDDGELEQVACWITVLI